MANNNNSEAKEKLLRDFIVNSEVEPLSFAGVNNIVVLKATINKSSFESPYTFYNFTSNQKKPLQTIVFKLLFLPPTSPSLLYGPSSYNNIKEAVKSVSKDEIVKESESQHDIYTKSFAVFKKPICPPIIDLKFAVGRNKRILTRMIRRIKITKTNVPNNTKRKNHHKLVHILARLALNKTKYPIAFIAMGEVNRNFFTIKDYTNPVNILQKIPTLSEKITFSQKTKYYVYAELFKLRLIQYVHGDFHSDNVLVANPFINVDKEVIETNDKGETLKNESGNPKMKTERREILLYDYINEQSAEVKKNICDKLNLDKSILDGERKDKPECILIDFGKAMIKEYSIPKFDVMPDYVEALKSSNNEFESIVSQPFGNTNVTTNTEKRTLINTKIHEIIMAQKDTWDMEALKKLEGNHQVLKLKILTNEGKQSPITEACEVALEKEREEDELVQRYEEESNAVNISNVSAARVSGIARGLESLSRTPSEHSEASTPRLGAFGQNENWGGGRRRTQKKKQRKHKRISRKN